MKILSFKEAEGKENKKYTFVLINDDGVKIKIDTEYLPSAILSQWEKIKDFFNDLIYLKESKTNILQLTGFNIKIGEPEQVVFEVNSASGGFSLKSKTDAVSIDLFYEGKDRYSADFVQFYDTIKVDFAELIVDNLELITKWDGGQIDMFQKTISVENPNIISEISSFEVTTSEGTSFKKILKKVL